MNPSAPCRKPKDMENSAVSSALPGAPPILRAWPNPEIVHGFAGREGGVSTGPFASLNLSYWVGDERDRVDENWRRMRAIIGADTSVRRLNQVHGNTVVALGREDASTRRAGDGMVTAESGVVLAVFTADCVPVLMFDEEKKVACALHAGWRGARAGIAAEGVRAMERQGAGAARIRAALGPSIGPCCFEVDAELASRFVREIPDSARHWRSGPPGKAYLDLRRIVADGLERAGVRRDAITEVGPCTRCESRRYFSRRAAGGGITGLQMSFIGFRA